MRSSTAFDPGGSSVVLKRDERVDGRIPDGGDLLVGLGFNSLQVQLNSEKDDAAGIGFEGSLEFSFSGLMLYAGVQF